MNDRKQAELLERYLLLLRRDPDAPPPAGLDPVVAELARRLKQQPPPRPNHAVRARVWQRALSATRHPEPFSSLAPDDLPVSGAGSPFHLADHQAKHPVIRSRWRVAYPVTISAAVMAVTLFFAAMLVFSGREGLNPSIGELHTGSTGTENSADSGDNSDSGDPDHHTDATLTASQIASQPVGGISIFGGKNAVSAALMAADINLPVVSATIGGTIDGQITAQQPVAIYQFNVPSNGVVIARAESAEFTPALFYSTQVTTLYSSMTSAQTPPLPLIGMSQGTSHQEIYTRQGTRASNGPVAGEPSLSESFLQGGSAVTTRVMGNPGRQIIFISSTLNPIWFPARAGDVIQLRVLSASLKQAGRFILRTRFLAPRELTGDHAETFTFNPAEPFGYFIFNGRSGDRLHLNIDGKQARQAFFFRTDKPLPFDILRRIPQSSGFPGDRYPVEPVDNGEFGIVIGPDDVQTTGTFSIMLKLD